ncbi:hypothetical protein [Asticcacaulis sp. YBE204]|uniref:hypothetical protein n=1 Tax=Asticcacaulis sp. YBE204 TaxID=1282363 RepID=UPI0003C402E0|nr:hypothetical protein [Asticcacaulis sp. YBE204]ESQ78666.1 hypothetical protein AEYBE204_11825 [Asticcacaulis sp. YBE204]
MNYDQLSIDLFQKFIRARSHAGRILPPLPYGWIDLPSKLHPAFIPYNEMVDGFSMELSNAGNQFRRYIDNLEAWETVILPLEISEKFHAIVEFVEPIANAALTAPYVIQNRFLFASAHLCHEANRNKVAAWIDDLPEDDKIQQLHADKAGKPWKKSYTRFRQALDPIAGPAHRAATHNFRNKFMHQFPQRIELGITSTAKRVKHPLTGKTCIGIGGDAPLLISDFLPELRKQYDHIVEAYARYRALVDAQSAFVRMKNEELLSVVNY